VAAEVDLGGRREPTERVAIARAHEERGFGEVVLGGDRLQRGIVEPAWQRTYRRRIAGEEGAREGIDLVDGELHRPPSKRAQSDERKTSYFRDLAVVESGNLTDVQFAT